MSVVNLPVSRLVNVGLVVTPQAVQAPALNTGLELTTDTVIDTVTRLRTYASLTAVGVDFGTNSVAYAAAVRWFAQSPQPTSLSIGRWCKTAAAGQLLMGPLLAANRLLSAWTAITTGSFKIGIDATGPTNVPALNFTGATTFPGIAAIMQTGLQAIGGAFAAATVKWDAVNARFIITSGTTGPSSAVTFLTAGTTGTDISGQMAGLAASPGAYLAPGIAAESALAAVVLFDNQFSGQWYNLFIPEASAPDSVAIAPFIDGNSTPHFYWVNSADPNILSAVDTTNIAYLLQQLAIQHSAVQYSSTDLYAVWSMAARIATVDYNGQNTCINLMYKVEPGVTPESLTETQANAVDFFNANVYVTYQFGSSTAIIEQGICPSGQFIDTIIGSDALRLQVQSNVLNLLITQPKVPQTDTGVGLLENGCDAAGDQFVLNGFLAPGVWSGTSFGQLVTGQWLDKGYYTFAPPIANQSAAQRSKRISPPIQMAANCAGAIDYVNITVYADA